jgi:alpha-beta hydrolase superfamily lysophospholipase
VAFRAPLLAIAAALLAIAPAPRRPYRDLEVRVSTRDHQTLAGTLSLPSTGRARYPAVLLLSTAEAQDRDASNVHGRYHPFRQIADTLVRSGIAVLRLDDRGIGHSTGRLDTLTTAERADDARDAIRFLRARADIDRSRIGLIGHSEGGIIAAGVAAGDTSVCALVLMAATARTGRAAVEWMNRMAINASGGAPSVRRRLLLDTMTEWSERVAKDRWAAYFDTHDPSESAQRIHTPTLILQGNSDIACSPQDADLWRALIRRSGNGDLTLVHLDGFDHAFLRTKDFDNGVPHDDSAYLLRAEVLGPIAAWLVKHMR